MRRYNYRFMIVTPFFPLLRAQLAAQGQRTCRALRLTGFPPLLEELRQLLPPELLAAEEKGGNRRNRIFSLRLTLECFLWQMLKPRTACREVVRAVQSLFQAQGRGRVDEGTSAYVQARHRLPKKRLEKALAHTARTADQRVGSQGQINGRPVKVADGSTTQLPDTQENQARYPQPSSQKPGCGFPLIKFLVLFSLSSGAILRVAMAHWKNHDLRLLHGLWDALDKGDILLGDRAYGEYLTLAALPPQGWTWWRGCTEPAAWIIAKRSNVLAATTDCSNGTKVISSLELSAPNNGRKCPAKSPCALFVLTPSSDAAKNV